MLASRTTHSMTRWYLPQLEVRVESADTHLEQELADCLRGWFFEQPVGEAVVPRLSIYAQCSSSDLRIPSDPPLADLGLGVRAWDRSTGTGARHVLVSDGKMSAEIQVVGDGLNALLCVPPVLDDVSVEQFRDFVEVLLSLLLPRLGYIPLPACEATVSRPGDSKSSQSVIVLGRPAARRDVVSRLHHEGWRETRRTQVFLTRDESGNVVVLGGERDPSHYRPRKVLRLLSERESTSSRVSPAWMRCAELSERLLGAPERSEPGVRLDELLEKTGGLTDVSWKNGCSCASDSLQKILKRRGKVAHPVQPGSRFRGFRRD